MNNKKTTAGAVLKRRNVWRVRFYAVAWFTALMTLCAPIYPLQNPPLNLSSANAAPTTLKQFARMQSVSMYGWDKEQSVCLSQLWQKESSWNPRADNPRSTAYGVAQMLNEKSKNALVQIDNGLRYINQRYENPCNAWKFWKRKSYY